MSNLRATLLVLILLSADLLVSITAVEAQSSDPIMVEGLPALQCGDELCLIPSRDIARGDHYAVEDWGWWFTYGPDLDFNGMDDRLQYVMDGAESMSTTKNLGADGRSTVAITVDFAWHPTSDDITVLKQILFAHGWVEDGSWFYVFDSVDSISLDHVPVSALIDIWLLEQVVVVEMQNVMVPSMETAAKAVRARDSDDYSGTLHDRGYDGSGVVIAVLDSGVDNEHRSLNDFDDKEDDPNLDSSSYSDQKWLGGYDATSQASNPDGTQDPDDGQGHGTHVAGIALGTGDSSRVHTGVAPGAFLVDVKVLTDSGGTNSQNSQSGIQWMINNRDTEWPGTTDAKGIQIGQMSFGSVSSPFGDDSTGDNGTSTEARLINNATVNGIVCVIAIGNDGRHRVASPSSADGAITVAAADDDDSVNRTDDFKASYSNWGPRDDDSDDDEWDELKPDVISYGSGIMSAEAATGSSLPGAPRPEADNGYVSKDGTSMSTPVVSGIVAIMLQADGSLTPQEVKDILRNSSEVRTDPSASSISDTWNDKWGFGLTDASCAVDTVLKRKCTPLTDDGDGVIIDPPTSNDSESATRIDSPVNGTWLIGGEMIRFQGSMLASSTIQWDRVEITLEQRFEDDEPITLMDWTEVGGNLDAWFLDVLIQNDWRSLDEDFTLVKARAISDTDSEISAESYIWTRIGRMTTSISSPSSTTDLVGAVTFSGIVEGVDHGILEYQINNDPWLEAMVLPEMEYGIQEWSFNWDSTTVEDGTHKIGVRMVNITDVKTETVSRTYTIDNMEAAPALSFQGSIEIIDGDLPANEAVAGSILEIRFNVVNSGDAIARDLHLVLNASGEKSETYPNEGRIPSIKSGETIPITLWWWATVAGTHTVTLSIDPNGLQNEFERSDNEYSFSFTIMERPEEPTLRFMTGAVIASPVIPQVNYPFTLEVRVDNLGQNDATNLKLTLSRWAEGDGWQDVENQTIIVVPGSNSSSGFAKVRFSDVSAQKGEISYRVILAGNGVDVQNSELRFGIIVDEYILGAPVTLSLSDGEYAIGFVSLGKGALLFTTKDGELHARTISSSLSMPGNTLIEADWAGEFAVVARSDDRAQVAWTKRNTDELGYILTDIGMTSIGYVGDMSETHSSMIALKQSEGLYWGLDLAERDGKVVLAGYHRDISTGGSWQDVTNIFLVSSENPDLTYGWSVTEGVVSDVDIKPQDGNSLAVAIGLKNTHILYQEMRDDVTGISRTGLHYAHGDIHSAGWSFQYTVGDNASGQQLEVLIRDNEDLLIAAWIEGEGRSSEVVSAVTDGGWSLQSPRRIEAPGVEKVMIVKAGGTHQLFYDEVGVHGPTSRYAMFQDAVDTQIGFSDLLSEGHLFAAGELDSDSLILLISPTGTLSVRPLASVEGNSNPIDSPSILDQILSPLPGDTIEQKVMVLAAIGMAMLFLLVGVVVTLRRSHEDIVLSVELIDEDSDLERLVEPEEDGPVSEVVEDIEISLNPFTVEVEEDRDLGQELEERAEAGAGSARLQRRVKRKQEREAAEIATELFAKLPPPPLPGAVMPSLTDISIAGATELPPPPAPSDLPPLAGLPPLEGLPPLDGLPPLNGLPPLDGLPPLPTPERSVTCSECSAIFTVKDMMLAKVNCPVCNEKINLR